MSKQRDNDRKLRNRYAGEAAGAVLEVLKEEGKIKSDRDAFCLVDEIQALYSAVSFTMTGKRACMKLSYYWLSAFARSIAGDYSEDKIKVLRLIIAPLLPETEFTDDELELIVFMDKEYSNVSTPVKRIWKEGKTLKLSTDVGKNLQHLVEKGIVSVGDGKATLQHDFRYTGSLDVLDEPLEKGKWYVDPSLSLAFAENPHIPSHNDDLIEALREAEEEYNTKWWAPIEKENERLRALFEEDLRDLKPTTRDYYLSDIYWFLDSYFYRETIPSIHDAAKNITDFFRYYICRCSGHSEYLVKRMASAVKRFYSVMYENGEVTLEERNNVISDVKNNLPWLIEAATDYEKRVEYFL